MHVAVNQNILEMEYAVRGPIPQRAAELRKEGRTTIPCNLGNPHALGQKPISYYRQVLSLVEDPSLIARERRLRDLAKNTETISESDLISDYVVDLAENYLERMGTGTGAYTESQGPAFIRKSVAAFIDRRDGLGGASIVSSDPDQIFITNGASEGAKYVIDLLLADERDGIMIPIPQYPLYSAAIKRCGAVQVNYYPYEEDGWTVDRSVLEDAYRKAEQEGVNVKGIVVINPGNPTGAVLDENTIQEVIAFAREKELVIIADEVYQENVYGDKFLSFAGALGAEPVPLFSLHSMSKGFYGECGHRGGYLEIRNSPKVTGTDLSFTDLVLKQASVNICSNTVGQLLMYLMVNPPTEDCEPYKQFMSEKRSILETLHQKAVMIRDAFDQMDGVSCFGRTGAMYLFPRLDKLPAGKTDFDYCIKLLERTGLCTVNGSGFGQKEGTQHLRIAFLPPKEVIEKVMPEWIRFHNEYVNS